jgi:hypothetical protein
MEAGRPVDITRQQHKANHWHNPRPINISRHPLHDCLPQTQQSTRNNSSWPDRGFRRIGGSHVRRLPQFANLLLARHFHPVCSGPTARIPCSCTWKKATQTHPFMQAKSAVQSNILRNMPRHKAK